MSDIAQRFGTIVRSSRTARGLSQESLAEIANLDRNYVGKVERGEAIPSIETMEKLSDALGEKLSSLIAQCEEN